MTTLLEKAFSEASKLPDIEQNVLAKWVLEELEADHAWEKKFSESEDKLSELAREALAEDELNETNDLDVKKL